MGILRDAIRQGMLRQLEFWGAMFDADEKGKKLAVRLTARGVVVMKEKK